MEPPMQTYRATTDVTVEFHHALHGRLRMELDEGETFAPQNEGEEFLTLNLLEPRGHVETHEPSDDDENPEE